jgi:CheY-like chemotaxis protein
MNQKTILLVEDEMLIAMSQKMFLEKYGYKVLTINTGEKAVEILRKDAEIELALLPDSKKAPLEKIGYTVILANNGEKAVELVKSTNGIDLVLMDIDLGAGMDGTQAAELILRQRNIPILFLSSHTEPAMVEKTEKITSYGYQHHGPRRVHKDGLQALRRLQRPQARAGGAQGNGTRARDDQKGTGRHKTGGGRRERILPERHQHGARAAFIPGSGPQGRNRQQILL